MSIDPILARTARTGGYDAENLLAHAMLARARGDGGLRRALNQATSPQSTQ
jgi:hypothetical protein